MGRTRRDCPVLGCPSKNLARLANHLEQAHQMDDDERAKWLQWSKMGVFGVAGDATSTTTEELDMKNMLSHLLHRQAEMEKKLDLVLEHVLLEKQNSRKRMCRKMK